MHLIVDEVDEHGVEEAVHLHDRHWAVAALGAVRLCSPVAGGSGRAGCSAGAAGKRQCAGRD